MCPIPVKIAEEYSIRDGSELEVISGEQGIIIKPVNQIPTLEELLAKCTSENPHEEYFSKPMGRELL